MKWFFQVAQKMNYVKLVPLNSYFPISLSRIVSDLNNRRACSFCQSAFVHDFAFDKSQLECANCGK
jgi:hypothetical protein